MSSQSYHIKPSFGENSYDRSDQDAHEIKKGPWTTEEDNILAQYIAIHGEGNWNSVACFSGLKRSGKSCRLRWINYLRPDLRRGKITLHEQLLILLLHCRWGNKWSKIARYLPGRTDNEIKNYWRTRVQKQAKQFKCEINSQQFKETMREIWIPRLIERIHDASQTSNCTQKQINSCSTDSITEWTNLNLPRFSGHLSSNNSSSSNNSLDCGQAQVCDEVNPPSPCGYYDWTTENGSGQTWGSYYGSTTVDTQSTEEMSNESIWW